MGEASEDKTVVQIGTDNPSDKSSTEKTKFPSLGLEERTWLIARLEAQRHRGIREYPIWKAELVTVLKSSPILDPILKMLEAEDLSSDNLEQKITQVIDAALRVVGGSLAPTLGDGLRYLVAQEVEKVIWQSKTVVVIRWGAVVLTSVLGAALLGGTIWGAYKVDGLVRFAAETEATIQSNLNTVRADATKAQQDLLTLHDSLREAATQKIGQQIQDEVDVIKKRLEQDAEKAEQVARTEVATKLGALDRTLQQLNSDYTDRSQTTFKAHNDATAKLWDAHNDATGKLWDTQEQNWMMVLTDRRNDIVSHFNSVRSIVDGGAETFKTNLDTILQEASRKTPELESRIRTLESQAADIANVTKILNAQVSILTTTHEKLDALITKLNDESKTVGFQWLIRVLEIKDGIALAAIGVSFLCFSYLLWRAIFAPFIWLYGKSVRRKALGAS